MSTSKPRIRPKPDPHRLQSGPPLHDTPVSAEHDSPIFTERDPDAERQPPERVIFQEDDRLH